MWNGFCYKFLCWTPMEWDEKIPYQKQPLHAEQEYELYDLKLKKE